MDDATGLLWYIPVNQNQYIGDLKMCYKIIHNELATLNDDFFCVFEAYTYYRGHNYKLFKGCSRVNTHKYFFSNRVAEIWNALPSTEHSSF